MKKALSLAMAGVMAVSTSVVATAAETDSAVAEMLAMVKERITVSDDISEFDYAASKQGPVTVYDFNWSTPRGAEEYKSVSVTAYRNIITSYHTYSGKDTWRDTRTLAKLTSDQLYSKAVSAVKQLNPTVASSIKVDKSSLYMNVYSTDASFQVYRVKNGIPVKGDSGRIVLDKDTGELVSFHISWHPKAAFKSKKGVLSEDEAWQKYGELISLAPRYEIDYDWEKDEFTSRLVYRQTDYGEINAFTGARSDFVSDGFYGDETEEICEEDAAENPATGGADKGNGFTEQELAEITKDLPYANEAAIAKLVKSNKYLTFDDGMVLDWDDVYKQKLGGEEKYIYSACFTTQTKEDYFEEEYFEEPIIIEYEEGTVEVAAEEEVGYDSTFYITVNAETGEIISYNYYTGEDTVADSYDMAKADKLAEKIMKSLAPDHVADYTDYSNGENSWETTVNENGRKVNKTQYYGSSHWFRRVANGIIVNGNYVLMTLDADMRLTSYSLEYTDVEFADPAEMLTADEALAKFRESHDLELYYKARTGKTKTATVLVYGADEDVYCDAFTGEQIWYWYNENNGNDLSGINDPTVFRKAKALDDNGIFIADGKFTENTPVSKDNFVSMMGFIGESGYPKGDTALPSGRKFSDDSFTLTRGDAMVLFTTFKCGNSVADIKGIFKNPFTDVKDDDSYLGYYAIAYALGATSGDKLNAGADYTYGELINLIYDSMT